MLSNTFCLDVFLSLDFFFFLIFNLIQFLFFNQFQISATVMRESVHTLKSMNKSSPFVARCSRTSHGTCDVTSVTQKHGDRRLCRGAV